MTKVSDTPPAQKSLKDMTETELKALGYDMLAQIQACQNNLNLLNQELATRKPTL